MKSILISIKPEWTAKILNGEKTVEIRKIAPKEWVDYLNGKTKDKPEPMIVYIYCTKEKPYLAYEKHVRKYVLCDTIEELGEYGNEVSPTGNACALRDWCVATNGHIVARFTLNEVEEIPSRQFSVYHFPYTETLDDYELLSKSCLTTEELDDYLGYDKNGYAWHISDLEIFDEPKELSEFYTLKCNQKKEPCNIKDVFGAEECHRLCKMCKSLTKAPQSWCYVVEGEYAK